MNDVVKAPKPHQFQKGVSGNPAGRPKGSKNAISIIKLQIEGELRAQMRPHMQEIVKEMIRQAMPSEKVDPKTGEVTIIPGSADMLKTLYNSWVSKTKATDEDAPKDKIQILIGKLDQPVTVGNKTFTNDGNEE